MYYQVQGELCHIIMEENRHLKHVQAMLPAHVHYKLINRAKYYDVTIQDLFNLVAEKFLAGEFDVELGIPVDIKTP